MSRLYIVCGGAPPTKDVHRILPRVLTAGWDVWVLPTPQGKEFLDVEAVERLTGHPARWDYRRPDEDRLPPADAILAAPITFNTVNKWAAGIADTFALGVLMEALGEQRQIVVVPWAKRALTSHPAFGRSVDLLRTMGASFIQTDSGNGVLGVDLSVPEFPWAAALAALSPTGGPGPQSPGEDWAETPRFQAERVRDELDQEE